MTLLPVGVVIGLDDVFDTVKVVDEAERLSDGLAGSVIDVKGEVNSLTNIRNNILHQDASPSLTANQIRQSARVLSRFAVGLADHLSRLIDQVEEGARTVNGEAPPHEE